MCVCLSVCPMCVYPIVFLTILQLLYLQPPKGEQKAAEGGPFASVHNTYTLGVFTLEIEHSLQLLLFCT